MLSKHQNIQITVISTTNNNPFLFQNEARENYALMKPQNESRG